MELAEEWRPVVGYEGVYEVSSLGVVRSVPRVVVDKRGRVYRHRGRVLRPDVNHGGYLALKLWVNNGQKRASVHKVVASAFHGPCPEGLEIRHLNGNQLDNRAANLAYGTHAENMQDAIRHGSRPGSTSPNHCIRGHERTPENTRPRKSGKRDCRACERLRSQQRDQKAA